MLAGLSLEPLEVRDSAESLLFIDCRLRPLVVDWAAEGKAIDDALLDIADALDLLDDMQLF